MGNAIFMVLHVIAVLFGLWALIFTIPAHLIYLMLAGSRAKDDLDRPSPETHIRCPDCRELVRKDATVCKHCRCRLVPQP